MKMIKKTKKNTVSLVVISTIVILSSFCYIFVLNGSVFGWRLNQITNTQETNTSRDTENSTHATQDQIEAGQIIKDSTIKDSLTQPDPTNQIQINASAVQNSSGLHISTIIQTSTSNGMCKLQLTNDSITITKESSTQALSSYSTCKGFDVASKDFNPGIWTMSITFTNGEKTGSTTSEIVLK